MPDEVLLDFTHVLSLGSRAEMQGRFEPQPAEVCPASLPPASLPPCFLTSLPPFPRGSERITQEAACFLLHHLFLRDTLRPSRRCLYALCFLNGTNVPESGPVRDSTREY